MELDKLIRDKDRFCNNNPMDQKVIRSMKSFINVSKKHKTILWLWRKCGSTHMTKVMNNFGFKQHEIYNDKLILVKNEVEKNHKCTLFKGHENYKILAAVRNPYTRFFSDYTFKRIPQAFTCSEQNLENFRRYVYQTAIYNEVLNDDCVNFPIRIPDYPVRLENLYEDYSKIPFIVESDYYKSGELHKDTMIKVNVSNEDENLWKQFYTQEIADIIYYRTSKHFDLFGYDKNSWKYE
jgi:hypothetical protein